MNDIENKIYKSAIVAAAGLGLLLFVVKTRKRIYNFIQQINDPMRCRRIKIIQTVDGCQRIVNQLKKDCSALKVLGFDCEWVTVGGTRRPLALLQLSSCEGLCALFRLCCMKQIPKSLRELLENEEIIKVGVAPQGDAQILAYDYGVGVASTLDLRFLAALTERKPESLAKMAKSVLNVQLDKHWRLVCSDWEAKDLSEEQLNYAANDALVAIEIFKRLSKDLKPRSVQLFGQNNYDSVLQKLKPYYDVKFFTNFNTKKTFENANNIVINNKKKTQVRHMSTRSRDLYDNCYLQAPDGELLCTIDKRKAKWYINKNLGSKINAEPFTVRLNFEPAGRAVGEVGKYYQTPKENQCVVCGQRDSFIRKNVVPREYRKHFPEVLKSHTSHDILLLCPCCHQISNISDLKIRYKLSQMCDAPFAYKEGANESSDIPALKQVKSAARTLLKCSDQIPVERRKLLELTILNYYKKKKVPISNELLQEASEIDTKEYNKSFNQHGEKVVQKFLKNYGGLLELEKIWREHFIHTMRPKYLPPLWNINHNANRLEIRVNEGRLNQADLILTGLNLDNEFAI